MGFIDDDFLLTNEPGKKLFHDHAVKMPIIDYHCHLDPKEIYENNNFTNITRIWLNEGLYGDHYKWRLMRANGVSESLITGDGDDYDKLVAWAETIQQAVGNPLYEWSQLELKRFFGIDERFTPGTAKAVWNKANALLATDNFKPRSLIRRSNVKVVCTTDDPASDLHYHQLLQAEEDQNEFKVLPAMRPDKLFNIESSDFGGYINRLGASANVSITDFASLSAALTERFKYFDALGGKLSDMGLNTFHYQPADEAQLDEILKRGINNDTFANATDLHAYQTALVLLFMKLNKQFNWTMQSHINAIRSANRPMFNKVGADTGFDSMGTQANMAQEMMRLFSAAQDQDLIPKVIIYPLNPNDWLQLATGMGDFYGDEIKQKLQLGAGWWFNDTRDGMRQQLTTMAQQSLLANFVGMLTDSRSFLSYPRHEYFRRVLCDYLGELVTRGQLPNDDEYLGKIVEDISYNNAHDYFGFFA